jgi:hypothetical protein
MAAEKMLRDQRQQESIVGLFFESAQGWRDSLLVTPTDAGPARTDARQKLADSTSVLLDRFLERLGEPQTRQIVAELAEERLLKDHRTLGAFVSDTFKVREPEVVEILSARALEFLVRPETAQAAARKICGLLFDFMEDNAQATIGEALRIDAAKKRALDDAVRARIPRVVEEVIPELSKTVTGSLHVHRLSAAAGAGMGFVIGCVLVLLRALGWR